MKLGWPFGNGSKLEKGGGPLYSHIDQFPDVDCPQEEGIATGKATPSTEGLPGETQLWAGSS